MELPWGTHTPLSARVTSLHYKRHPWGLSFNHVRSRGVAGSVHLIYSNDRKLDWKGGGRTHPQQHHPLPLQEILTEAHWKSTTMPTVQHSLTMTFHHTPTTTPSCVGGANLPPHNQQPFTRWQPSLQPDRARHFTWSSTSLTDLTGLEGICRANGGGVAKVKGRARREGAGRPPLTPHQQGPRSKHSSRKPGRTWGQRQLINTHTHCTLTTTAHIKLVFFSKPLILLWCGQLLDFCLGQLPVANFTRIMLHGSSWPHPSRNIFYIYGFLGTYTHHFIT